MPRWIDAVSRLLPLRYLNEGMLDVMVRGLGPAAIWQPFLVLLAFAAAMTLLASRFFRWEAD
jgi:ABC-2 type transport system permease protein